MADDAIKPPPALARMLEWTKSRQTSSTELYDDFLLYAERAVAESKAMQVRAPVTCRFTGSFVCSPDLLGQY